MADIAPLRAIIDAWEIFNSLCNDVIASFEVEGMNAQPSIHRNVATVDRQLQMLGLSRESVVVFDRLRGLRNRAAHMGTDVTPVAARDFIDSCLTLAREVEALASR